MRNSKGRGKREKVQAGAPGEKADPRDQVLAMLFDSQDAHGYTCLLFLTPSHFRKL
jgi:hypothetical protein